MSKRDFADFKKSHDKKYQVFEYTWLSFKSLKKHLLANNKEIKLLHPL